MIASIARSLWFRLGVTLAILTWLASSIDLADALRAIARVDLAAVASVAPCSSPSTAW